MNDIYSVGTITNPFSWAQPKKAAQPAPEAMQAEPLPAIPALAPYLNVPDFSAVNTPRPQVPSYTLPMDYSSVSQPINYLPAVRPPFRADAPQEEMTPGIDMPLPEIIRRRKLAVESGDWKAPLHAVRGNYQARNRDKPGNTASGAYQYTNRTWNNYGGYAEAALAPAHVQDARVNEDISRSLRKFNGDIFKVFAEHMLPAQANKPWLWDQPSTLTLGGKVHHIPPVLEYVRRSVYGTPYEAQLEQYIAAHKARASQR